MPRQLSDPALQHGPGRNTCAPTGTTAERQVKNQRWRQQKRRVWRPSGHGVLPPTPSPCLAIKKRGSWRQQRTRLTICSRGVRRILLIPTQPACLSVSAELPPCQPCDLAGARQLTLPAVNSSRNISDTFHAHLDDMLLLPAGQFDAGAAVRGAAVRGVAVRALGVNRGPRLFDGVSTPRQPLSRVQSDLWPG